MALALGTGLKFTDVTAKGNRVEISLFGEQNLLRMLREMPVNLGKRGLRRGLTKAGRRIVKRAKSNAKKSKETGTLWKSIGSKTWTSRDGMVIQVIVGPRKGHAKQVRVVQRGKNRGRRRLVGKKSFFGGTEVRDPVKYAHLVEFHNRKGRTAFLKPAIKASLTETVGIVRFEVLAELKKHQQRGQSRG